MGHSQQLQPLLERDVAGATSALWICFYYGLISYIPTLLCLLQKLWSKERSSHDRGFYFLYFYISHFLYFFPLLVLSCCLNIFFFFSEA